MRPLVRKRRWIYITVFFFFLFLHQFSVVRLEPIEAQIRATFNLSDVRLDKLYLVGQAVVIASLFLAGYFSDIHSRRRVLTMVALLWGGSAWLLSVSPTWATFLISYLISAIDDLGFAGIFSMIADLFLPRQRGKIVGLLLAAQPLIFLISIPFSNSMGLITINWRIFYLIVGAIGLWMGWVIYQFIQDPKRGQSEPILAHTQLNGLYFFDWSSARSLLHKPAFWLMMLQAFFGIMPWAILTARLFPFLHNTRGYAVPEIFLSLLPGLLALMLGYPLGGFLGDWLTRRFKLARIYVGMLGSSLAMISLIVAFQISDIRSSAFITTMLLTGFFTAFERPNMIAQLFEITLPEIRSSAFSFYVFSQLAGSFFIGILGYLASNRIAERAVIMTGCILGWLLSLVCLSALIRLLPREIEALNKHLVFRCRMEGNIIPSRGERTSEIR